MAQFHRETNKPANIAIRNLSPKEKRLAQVLKVLAAILAVMYLAYLAWPR